MADTARETKPDELPPVPPEIPKQTTRDGGSTTAAGRVTETQASSRAEADQALRAEHGRANTDDQASGQRSRDRSGDGGRSASGSGDDGRSSASGSGDDGRSIADGHNSLRQSPEMQAHLDAARARKEDASWGADSRTYDPATVTEDGVEEPLPP
jgi:hypothetical protein